MNPDEGGSRNALGLNIFFYLLEDDSLLCKLLDIALWHYKAFAFMSKLSTLLG